MASTLDTPRLLREGAPVAVILLFWVVLSSFVRSDIGSGLLRAGGIMALLYTLLRGIAIAETAHVTTQPTDVEGILRENATVAVPAGAWFLAAHLIHVVENFWDRFGIPGVGTSPANALSYVFIGTGVAVVLLYAVAVGISRIRHTGLPGGPDTPAVSPADD